MSASARWSYTAKATIWPLTGRAPRTGVETFGAPVVIDCGYSSSDARVTGANGVELVAKMSIFTEHATAKPGDRVILGASVAADPVAAGADSIISVKRNEDTFDRVADDFVLLV